MPRAGSASAYVCQTCAAAFPRWEGQCRACGAWNSLVETRASGQPRAAPRPARARRSAGSSGSAIEVRPLAALEATAAPRLPTGIGEVDRVLGGGLVPGSLLLLGGEPGIGKSTLVLQVAAAMAAATAGRRPRTVGTG